jgi:hypothetical protein
LPTSAASAGTPMALNYNSEPVILRWHPGGLGALWDSNLELHNGRELLRWAKTGKKFIVLDHETGRDITRVFLASWNDSLTEVIDPVSG